MNGPPVDFGGMKSNGDRSVASSFGLRSGLRQSGSRFAAAFYGTPEGVPFRLGVGYGLISGWLWIDVESLEEGGSLCDGFLRHA
jgi:hypothetical protein